MNTEDICIHDQFRTIVNEQPDQPALKYLGTTLSYSQLDEHANYLANYLLSKGLNSGDVVALLMARSTEMIISMLAILKCGAAFLPLDINNPISRNQYCLEETSTQFVISDRDCGELESKDRMIIQIKNNPIFNLNMKSFTSPVTNGNTMAYIMYTSGSTGKPKGVMVPHRAIARLVIETNYINIKPTDNILQFSSPSFDASTLEIWGALLNGATLVLYSGLMLDPNLFKKEIAENQISILWLTAGLFHIIAEKFISVLRPVNTLLAGGDVLNPNAVNKVIDNIPGITVINGYGPTENTTFTCCHRMNCNNKPAGNVPIGLPVTGTQVYILDEQLCAANQGEIGELVVGGQGVALGYVGDNNDQFFLNNTISDGLLYRTGDLVRQKVNGEIEFQGRKDNQVKIRGFRVSLDEIKTSLLDFSELSDAAVFVQKDENGDQLLLAYLQPLSGNKLSINTIRKELSLIFPNYMIPDKFIECKKLPINRNGKIDVQTIRLNQA